MGSISFILVAFIVAMAGTSGTLPVSAHSLSPWVNARCHKRPQLICVLRPTTGNKVRGVVKFRAVRNRRFRRSKGQKRCHVQISTVVRGLTPGQHGMHAHSFGDERAADGSSLGAHFPNPQFIPIDHGLPDDRVRHWGDFGNMVAGQDGVARYSYVDKVITIRGIVGRGIIVHAGRDKGAAFQPSGDSGARVASCVIGFANEDL